MPRTVAISKYFKLVKKNKGAPCKLKSGEYKPSPVKRTYIDKDDGTKRPLGIPTFKDRVVQQVVINIIEPIFEKTFHPSSYGYRANRSCQMAVEKAESFANHWGLQYVVDMDLSKCFATLNHDIIIDSVNEKISDGKVLKLIRNFLESGILEGGAFSETTIGSPQGGVIYPLLMNIYMEKFDKRMKSLNIRIVRYVDDILILQNRKAKQADIEKLLLKY